MLLDGSILLLLWVIYININCCIVLHVGIKFVFARFPLCVLVHHRSHFFVVALLVAIQCPHHMPCYVVLAFPSAPVEPIAKGIRGLVCPDDNTP